MKIALVCTEKLPVPCISGGAIQQYIDGVLPYLSLHHDITVYCVSHPQLPPFEEKDSVKYIRMPGKNAAEYLENLKKTITNEFDIIHIFNRPNWVVDLGKVLPDVKFSLSLHNEMFHPEKISNTRALECINKVEFINTVSKFIADGVKKLYPAAEGKLRVVYSAADIYKYKPFWTQEAAQNRINLRNKYNLGNLKVVLFVGRLGEKKGAHVLIKAMRTLMDARNDLALFIIGSKWYGSNNEDDYSKSIRTLAKHLKGPVVFTGFLPPSDIPQYYNIGDVFICCSQWNEPLARVHYEAMAAGLPIITTNRGGNSEVVSGMDNGIVIDEYNNPDILAGYINYILNNPDVASRMGKNGRILAEERFNWKRVSDDLLKGFSTVKCNNQ